MLCCKFCAPRTQGNRDWQHSACVVEASAVRDGCLGVRSRREVDECVVLVIDMRT